MSHCEGWESPAVGLGDYLRREVTMGGRGRANDTEREKETEEKPVREPVPRWFTACDTGDPLAEKRRFAKLI